MSDYVLKVRTRSPSHRPGRGRPSARRCGSAWCSSAGIRTRSVLERMLIGGHRDGRRARRPRRLPAGADPFPVLRDHARRCRGAGVAPESLEDGPTATFARGAPPSTAPTCTHRCTSRPTAATGSGYNTAILVSPDGELVQRTRKLHIPITAGYYEDRYFRRARPAARATRSRVPLRLQGRTRELGLPTCWDQWFPELARAYSLAGAEVLIYPTAIGSEPDHPDVRHRAAVGAGDRRQRDRERHVHGRDQPDRRRRTADLLRLELHLRSLRPDPRAGTARPTRRS